MSSMIVVSEEKNRLFFEHPYTPVVCGNSSYYIRIHFTSDEFNTCDKKYAVLVVDEKKKQLPFEGNLFKLPALPNASHFMLMVYVKDGEDIYSTTAIKIRLEPTPIGNLIKFKFN